MTEIEFTNECAILLKDENESMFNEFISYWTEKGIRGKKMRFEKEPVFDIKRRFATWKRNSTKFNNKPNAINGTINAYNEVLNMINRGEI